MMQKFERDYADLIRKVQAQGEKRETRNGLTRSLFGEQLKIELNNTNKFPIIQGRKMYPAGVLGELAAMLRKPKCIADFEKWGCNYWKQWANEDGTINVDYGNSWFDFNGVDQIAQLKDKIANNPADRRMIITGWKPDGMDELSLPCCHCFYQFYVNEDGYLDMIWYQRSVDLMVGLPSDIIFAAAWLEAIAGQFGLMTGIITMMLGDCHIYEEHLPGVEIYLANVQAQVPSMQHPTFRFKTRKDFCDFEPSDIQLSLYPSCPPIKLELKA